MTIPDVSEHDGRDLEYKQEKFGELRNMYRIREANVKQEN